jgi:hypothetical protein
MSNGTHLAGNGFYSRRLAQEFQGRTNETDITLSIN